MSVDLVMTGQFVFNMHEKHTHPWLLVTRKKKRNCTQKIIDIIGKKCL